MTSEATPNPLQGSKPDTDAPVRRRGRWPAERASARPDPLSATLVDSLNGIVWEADGRTFRFLFVSPQAPRLLGYPVDQWLDEPNFWLNHTHPDDRDWCSAFRLDATERAHDHELEYRMIAADGRIVWLHDIVTVITDFEGNPLLRGIMLDVTERKRAAEELALLQATALAISEAGDPQTALKIVLKKLCEATGWDLGQVWMPSADGTKLECSTAWYGSLPQVEPFHRHSRSISFTPGLGLVGRAWQERVCVWLEDITAHPASRRFPVALETGLKTGVAFPMAGDGILGVIELFSRERRSEDPRIVRVVSAVAAHLGSALRRKRAEEDTLRWKKRYEAAIQAIGQLAGGVAHDFNNLLAVLTGSAELLLEILPSGSPAVEPLHDMLRAGDHAVSLTRQLLAFSRKQVSAPRVLDLNASVEDTRRMLRRLIGEHVALSTNLQPDLWPIKADPGQIEQILINLAVNARDAMPRGGTLMIETSNRVLEETDCHGPLEPLPGKYVLLAVSDTGSGISLDLQSRIFEPFFTTKEPGKGTGLGLAMVHGIVKQSGGSIEVESQPDRRSRCSPLRAAIPEAGDFRRLALYVPHIGRTSLILEPIRPGLEPWDL